MLRTPFSAKYSYSSLLKSPLVSKADTSDKAPALWRNGKIAPNGKGPVRPSPRGEISGSTYSCVTTGDANPSVRTIKQRLALRLRPKPSATLCSSKSRSSVAWSLQIICRTQRSQLSCLERLLTNSSGCVGLASICEPAAWLDDTDVGRLAADGFDAAVAAALPLDFDGGEKPSRIPKFLLALPFTSTFELEFEFELEPEPEFEFEFELFEFVCKCGFVFEFVFANKNSSSAHFMPMISANTSPSSRTSSENG